MPIYEYTCETCGDFEHLAKASEDSLTVCPECAEKGLVAKVIRRVSKAAFHLKGGGWYKDLYSTPAKTDGAAASGTAAASTEAAAPAAKSEATASSSTPATTATTTPAPTASTKPAASGNGSS